jgi:hypothetical protein
MELSVLFPFRAMFRQLGLSNKWWHRLVAGLFAAVLLAVLFVRISETVDDAGENDGELSGEALQFMHQQMRPEHKLSPDERRALTKHFEKISAYNDHEADERLWWDCVLTFGLLASLSYILQSLYGAIIWMAYRNRLRSEHLGQRRA